MKLAIAKPLASDTKLAKCNFGVFCHFLPVPSEKE